MAKWDNTHDGILSWKKANDAYFDRLKLKESYEEGFKEGNKNIKLGRMEAFKEGFKEGLNEYSQRIKEVQLKAIKGEIKLLRLFLQTGLNSDVIEDKLTLLRKMHHANVEFNYCKYIQDHPNDSEDKIIQDLGLGIED